MYGVGGGGTGAVQQGEKRERGQSQSESEEDEGSLGEESLRRGRKRLCREMGGGEARGGSDSEGEGGDGEWVKTEMEELEERRMTDELWGGGDEMNRKRRRREWDVEGWGEWEIVIDEMGEEAMEGEEGVRGSSAAESNVNELHEDVKGGRNDDERVRDVEGEGMDGGGRGGRRQREKLPLVRPISRREPLRGRRRGAKAGKEQEERMLSQQLLKWLDKTQRRDTKGSTLEEGESH